ncbi:YppE family protein [Fictibacillus phosphorivorans]|uniref:YppE family protein n=1 Tax=Fictibacillus phosphorivorans TaxID=1221500 RepID=UPI0020401929|nr:YppE family protein [Fictibacillus phosphorivorans]MCM3718888.1 YppE family protein [Fictibacillus phosphorivorans]MCM3776510.1 YppE family protein [Fictibacillus phosphorivorans]
MSTLYDKTTELIADINEAFHIYKTVTKVREAEADFYSEVKPFADRIHSRVKEWEPLAREWVITNKPKYLYPIQIKTAAENIGYLGVYVFQKNMKDKRITEMVKSVLYVLNQMKEQLNEQGK